MRRKFRWLTFLYIITGSLITPGIAFAGSIEVAPTTLLFSAASHASILHITNRGSQTVFAQIEAFDWGQPDMRDQLTPSRTLQVSPPVVHLAPGQKQTIRVIVFPQDNATVERAYRLSINELPDPAARKQGIQVLLQFLVPVFVELPEIHSPKLTWKVAEQADGVVLTATNFGAQHLKLSGLSVSTAEGREIAVSTKALTYLLPGAAHQWKIASSFGVTAGTALTIQMNDETHGTIKGSYVVEK